MNNHSKECSSLETITRQRDMNKLPAGALCCQTMQGLLSWATRLHEQATLSGDSWQSCYYGPANRSPSSARWYLQVRALETFEGAMQPCALLLELTLLLASDNISQEESGQ